MDGWKQNDWRKADGAPVKNKVSQNMEHIYSSTSSLKKIVRLKTAAQGQQRCQYLSYFS
jgi:hypothetical protein